MKTKHMYTWISTNNPPINDPLIDLLVTKTANGGDLAHALRGLATLLSLPVGRRGPAPAEDREGDAAHDRERRDDHADGDTRLGGGGEAGGEIVGTLGAGGTGRGRPCAGRASRGRRLGKVEVSRRHVETGDLDVEVGGFDERLLDRQRYGQ